MLYYTPRSRVLKEHHINTLEFDNAKNSEVSLSYGLNFDLTTAPHLLIAGATGSGKSVTLHNIIISLMCKNTPNTARFIMIDPKRIELSMYKDSLMLQTPIAKGADEGLKALEYACKLMDKRYMEMEKEGIREYKGYRLYVIIDELADLMLTSGKTAENLVIRLAQLGRACGIHLIVATQRPTAKVITGLIKSNIKATICLKVRNGLDSRIALGYKGAEDLEKYHGILDTGDINDKPIIFKGDYLSDEKINGIVEQTRKNKLIDRLRTGIANCVIGG